MLSIDISKEQNIEDIKFIFDDFEHSSQLYEWFIKYVNVDDFNCCESNDRYK